MHPTTRKVLRLVMAWALAIVLSACGGGGGSTAPTGTAPAISNLSISPEAAYVSSDPQTFSVQLDFTDDQGDLTAISLRVRNLLGELVLDLGWLPVEGPDTLTEGSILGEIGVANEPAGRYLVEVQTRDRLGLLSNVLTATVRIADFPWTQVLAAPMAREYAGVAALDGKVYVAGGQRTDTGVVPGPATNALEVYDPATNTWANLPAMPTARMGLTLTAWGGKLYAMGGRTDGYSISAVGTVEIYDPVTGLWRTGTPMPTPRFHAGAAATGSAIVVAGGELETNVLATVEAYLPDTDTWQARAALPSPRAQLGLQTVGSTVYAVGGYGGLLPQWVATVSAYDALTDQWSARQPMANARAFAATAVADGALWVAGGENVERALDVLERYDPLTDTWRTVTASPRAFGRTGAATVNGRVFVPGNGFTLAYDPANEIR